jgi:hypothetical protein
VSEAVWYEFMNTNEGSASPARNLRLSEFADDEGEERLVWRQGLEKWTPMKEALSQHGEGSSSSSQRRSSTESPEVSNVTHGLSVRPDPRTGGLIGLPDAWTSLLPEGCTPDSKSDDALPPELRPTAMAKPGDKLHDKMVIGSPYNVAR